MLLREWMARLTTDPIDPADPKEDRYLRLHEAGAGSVDDIKSLIDLADGATTQLFSGPRGSGKTTELMRLRGALGEAGYTVVLVDILDFVNQSSEIDITEFLIALALGFGEEILPSEVIEERGFASRFWSFMKRTRVSVEGVRAEAFGVGVEFDLKREMKSSKAFVDQLRERLGFVLGELQAEVVGYLRDTVESHRAERADCSGVVMVVDNLEKLRGTTGNDDAVQASAEGLFVHHADKLRFASHHTVYTVPPFLMFTDPGALPYDGPVRPVPIPQVRTRGREVVQSGVDQLVEVVRLRIEWDRLLESRALLDEIVVASGGHLRDLFRILRELITLVNGRGIDLPVPADHVRTAIESVARGFSQITQEDADFLRLVHEAQGTAKPSKDQVKALARLVDTHMLLTHMNGETWYEVHPLARRTLGLE